MEPEEAEEFLNTSSINTAVKKKLNDDIMQKSTWKPGLSEFAIATLVFGCFLGIIFVGLGCVFLMILGWMSYTMFFLMVFGLIACLVFLFMDPCSMMLVKRIQKRRRSAGNNKNFDSSTTWTEMISLTPKVNRGMKKNRRRKNKKQKEQKTTQPSPDPHVIRSSPSRPAPAAPLSSTTELNELS